LPASRLSPVAAPLTQLTVYAGARDMWAQVRW